MERGDGGRRLLVWDAPSMDRCLSEVLGLRAAPTTRPDLAAVLRWAESRSRGTAPLEASVFCVVPSGLEAKIAPWVASLRHLGFAVFAKPTSTRRDAVGAEILRYVERCRNHRPLVELVVASHDAATLAEPLRRWQAAGTCVVVVGYREKADEAIVRAPLTFVDVEDVPGAFDRPLSRTNLFELPRGGRWFDPLAPDASSNGSAAAAPGRPTGSSAADGAAVVALVEAEVEAVVAGGAEGVTLRRAGELVRERFAGCSLSELGFSSVGDLVARLEATGRLRLVRTAEDGSAGNKHLLTVARPASPEPDDTDAGPSSVADTEAEPLPLADGVEAAPPSFADAEAEPLPSADDFEATPPNPADTEATPPNPADTEATPLPSADAAAPGPAVGPVGDHPIYRVFRPRNRA